MSKRMLLIVEGPSDEEVLIKKLWDRFDKGADYEIVTYKTNVYVLMRALFIDGVIDEDLDLVRLLRSEDNPSGIRLDRSEKFTDVFMVFDLDPQDPNADLDMLGKMLRFFDDSTSKGKLFINYPMMQSYRHITGQNDPGFKDRMVPANIGRRYKSMVDKEAWNRLKQINRLNRDTLRWIIELHLSKMSYIVNGSFEIPSYRAYKNMTGDLVLRKQLEVIRIQGSVYVLNTSMFLIVDYCPSWFFPDVEPGR